jgi:hypothetical protein
MITILSSRKFATRSKKREVGQYKDVLEYQYTSGADGEASISLPALIGKEIIQIEKEIKPLLSSEYSFNASSGLLTLIGTTADAGQTLFILYKTTITY